MNILIAGDYCPQRRVTSLLEKGDYNSVLGSIRPINESADYSIVNLECPITVGNEKPIVKCGPILNCSINGIKALKWAGFDCVTLANNHFRDYGDDGVENTLKVCSEIKMDTVGGGLSLGEAQSPLYKQIGNKVLAIINCCEHEYSIATEMSGGSNPLNPIRQFYSIRDARKEADYVLVIVHGGHELWPFPSPRMLETYRYFIDAGADAVVNHHQHCFSGYEVYNGRPIIYGIGNFCFDKPNYFAGLWEYGYLAYLHFSDTISFDIIPYEQCKKIPGVELIEDRHDFEKRLKKLNAIIANEKMLIEQTAYFYKQSEDFLRLALEPYNGRLFSKLFLMGCLPRLMTKKKLMKIQNLLTCESHRDKMLYVLNDQIKDIDL